MKPLIVAIALTSLCTTPAWAAKPDWAGSGKPSAEQREGMKNAQRDGEEHSNDMLKQYEREKERNEQDYSDKKDKKDKKDKQLKADKDRKLDQAERESSKGNEDAQDQLKGLDKQRQKKSEQTRNELDKGSDQGQAARQEHSRKWWKFWE